MSYEGKALERILWLVLWKVPLGAFGLLLISATIWVLYISGGLALVFGVLVFVAWAMAVVALFTRMLARMSGELKDD